MATDDKPTCDYEIHHHDDAGKVWVTVCVLKPGHKDEHRDAEQVEARAQRRRERYNALSDAEKAVYNRNKNRARKDRQK